MIYIQFVHPDRGYILIQTINNENEIENHYDSGCANLANRNSGKENFQLNQKPGGIFETQSTAVVKLI